MFMASGANSKPMMATIDPMAAGGNKMSIHFVPTLSTTAAKMMKDRPKTMKPPWASP